MDDLSASIINRVLKDLNVTLGGIKQSLDRIASCLEKSSHSATSPPDDYDESPERRAEHAEQIRDDREDR